MACENVRLKLFSSTVTASELLVGALKGIEIRTKHFVVIRRGGHLAQMRVELVIVKAGRAFAINESGTCPLPLHMSHRRMVRFSLYY